MKIFILFQSDTFGLKIRLKNFDLSFALVLCFLHWCYSLTALLSTNQNRVIFSCMLLLCILCPDRIYRVYMSKVAILYIVYILEDLKERRSVYSVY